VAGVRREDKRVFHALDGLRGVAAVFVAMRHTFFFHSLGIRGGYLAVDLFFVLSGFVIAHAYERRLEQGLSPARFLMLRYLRLWPVYVLGGVLGLIAAAFQALPGHDNLTLNQVAHTAPFALLMLPGPHIKPMLYPVNSVAWSLALELLVNLAYALVWRRLRDIHVLGGVLAISALALIGAVLWFGKLDVGFTWYNAWGGLPRVIFSFTAGLAVYRVFKDRPWRSPLPGWAPILALPPLFCLHLDNVVWPLVCVLGVFPLVVLAGAASEPGPRTARAFTWLGAVSYPLYALHKPTGELLTLAIHVFLPGNLHWGVWIGAPYMVLAMIACAGIERFYDRPARRLLTGAIDKGVQRVAAWRRPEAPATSGLLIEPRT
jgi:peptidoglycan/LPS O-acetylase OafA/YrhL